MSVDSLTKITGKITGKIKGQVTGKLKGQVTGKIRQLTLNQLLPSPLFNSNGLGRGLANDLSKRLLCFALSLSLVFSAQPFFLQAQSQTPRDFSPLVSQGVLQAEEAEALAEYEQTIESLREAFRTSSVEGQHPLDTYHLLSQELLEDPKAAHKAQIQHVEEVDFQDRRAQEVEFLLEQVQKDRSRALDYIGRMALRRAAQELNLDPEKDVEAIIRGALTNDRVADWLEIGKENIEHFVADPRARRVKLRNLELHIKDPGSERAQEIIRLKDNYGSAGLGFSSASGFYFDTHGKNLIFELHTSQGVSLHRFLRPVIAAGFWGPFLVYVEKNSFNAEDETFALRFIDLEYFQGALGNTALPVFSLPISSSIDLNHIEVRQGHLYLNDTELSVETMRFLSGVFQILYNVAVSLVDPRTFASAELLIEQLGLVFDRSLSASGEVVEQMLMSAVGGSDNLDALVEGQKKALSTQAKISHLESDKAKLEALTGKLEKSEMAKEEYLPTLEELKKMIGSRKGLTEANHSLMLSRKFLARVSMLLERMAHPQPMGAPKLLNAMAMVAESGVSGRSVDFQRSYAEANQHPLFRYGKYGAGVMAAALLGSTLPEPYTVNVFQSLDLVEMINTHIFGYLAHTGYGGNFVDIVSLASEKIGTSASYVGDQFFADGRYQYTGTLMLALTGFLVTIFGVPHLLTNTTKAFKYMYSEKGRYSEQVKSKAMSRWQAIKQLFIDFEDQERKVYDQAAAEAEQEALEKAMKANEASQSARVEKIYEGVEEELRQQEELARRQAEDSIARELVQGGLATGQRLSFDSSPKSAPIIDMTQGESGAWTLGDYKTQAVFPVEEALSDQIADIEDSTEAVRRVEQALAEQGKEIRNIETFGQAIRQFALSYPSVTNTAAVLAKTWNLIFITRNFAIKPRTWYMVLVFPNYFKVTSSSFEKAGHIPTLFDGGRDDTLHFWSNRIGAKFGKESLNNLLAFEKTILHVEAEAYQVALERGIEALIQYTQRPDHLKDLFDSSQLPRGLVPRKHINDGAVAPSTGIQGISDAKVGRLSKKESTFFQHFVVSLYRDLVEDYLKDFLAGKGESPIELAQVSSRQVKSRAAQFVEELKGFQPPEKAPGVDDRVWQAQQKEYQARKKELRLKLREVATHLVERSGAFEKSRAMAEDWSHAIDRLTVRAEGSLMNSLHPQQTQISRYTTAARKLKKFKALLRAVRHQLANLVVSFPVTFGGVMVLYAGVFDGSLMQPIHEEAFGPNSAFHGSLYIYFNSFLAGAIIGFMADTWMKLQQDDRLDAMGSFDKVPSVKDSKKGFWRYYFKNAFKNPVNRWIDNQLYYSYLIWANIPAYFVMAAVTHWLVFQRFDLGLFMGTLILAFVTPFMGIGLKFDQAYELAASWVAAKFPRRLRGHPEIQKQIRSDLQKKRIYHQVGHSIYGEVVSAFESLVALMDHPTHGKRAFLSTIFFGYQPEEIISKGLQGVVKVAGWIPGVESAATACEFWLTNNNASLNPDRLMQRPTRE